jgi:hypothetical protein
MQVETFSNALRVIPIVIDRAEKSASDVVRCTSIYLGYGRKRWDGGWNAVVQPLSDGFL